MITSDFTLFSRISNKIKRNYRFLVRARGKTIYHCCIQKSGSQWFKKIFNDKIFWNEFKLAIHSPMENFIIDNPKLLQRLNYLPQDALISPLYIRFNDFNNFDKPDNFRAFFVARDPRDLIISNYFSLKYSHDPYHPYILKMRKHLNSISQSDGITELIQSFTPGIYQTLNGWLTQKSENIRLIKFEDIFGVAQFKFFKELLNHCGIGLNDDDISMLLKKYSFKNISGRSQGIEDKKKHYRKGVHGDWKHYFNDKQKKIFKELSHDLLIIYGYEQNYDW